MRFLIGLILGGVIGFGAALWFQGEPPFVEKAKPQKGQLVVIISNTYLTHHVAPQVSSQSQGTISDVQVRTQAGNTVFVEAKAGALGLGIPVGVELGLEIKNATVAVNVRIAHLGPVPIPGVFTGPLQDTVNSRIAAETQNRAFRVVSADTTATGVRIGLDEK